MLIQKQNSFSSSSSSKSSLIKQTTVSPYNLWKDLSPWRFIKDLLNLLYTILYWIIRFDLQLAVFIMQGVMSLKKRGVRQLMGRRNRLYNKSFYVLLMIVGVLVFVGWSISVPGLTDVNAGDKSDFYALAISPNDLFVEKGSLETLIPQSRPRFDVEIYVVKPNDTLSKIASYFKVSEDTLKWANKLKNSNSLKIGQKLNVPPGTGILHKVKTGDTVKSIAQKYRGGNSATGISQLIIEVNWLDPPYTLTAGSTVFVPNGVIPVPRPVVAVAPPINRYVPRYTPPSSITPPSNVGRFLSWPVAGGRGAVTQCPSAYHVAVDIADAGMPDLVAAADGTVIYAGRHNSGYAWMVMVDHGNGYTTLYAHMNRVYVKKGARVGRGQVLGQMGATGLATGVHVHFELRRGYGFQGRTTNASPFMRNHICGY